MEFKYELSGAGWANGFIEINSNTEYFSASYLSDAMYDLLKALISLLPELSPSPVISAQSQMHEEPGGKDWTLNRIDSCYLNINIVSFEDLVRRKKLTQNFNETCKISEFVKAVITSLDLLLQQHGLEGYKVKWINYDFPKKEYSILKDFLHGGIID